MKIIIASMIVGALVGGLWGVLFGLGVIALPGLGTLGADTLATLLGVVVKWASIGMLLLGSTTWMVVTMRQTRSEGV